MLNRSGLTTMPGRTKISLPMRWLVKKDMIGCERDRRLDYGCGKGFDADALGMMKYDLNHFPVLPAGEFDIITCIYVLNVIENPDERNEVADHIISRTQQFIGHAEQHDDMTVVVVVKK